MDFVMELDQLNGKMSQLMKVSGFKVLVMVMEFTEQRQAKNIEVNGKMMFVTEKANGPKQMAQSFLEISETICVMGYAQYKIKVKEILN